MTEKEEHHNMEKEEKQITRDASYTQGICTVKTNSHNTWL